MVRQRPEFAGQDGSPRRSRYQHWGQRCARSSGRWSVARRPSAPAAAAPGAANNNETLPILNAFDIRTALQGDHLW